LFLLRDGNPMLLIRAGFFSRFEDSKLVERYQLSAHRPNIVFTGASAFEEE
jgi:hypothetical protein